ncbi:pyridine nucleotide-disulfide oxidoreductase [Desulfosarcina ovata subsp. sediminis]|uniref:Pyridine nucleotide-disulfide oxidoreductase n=1 Tax=Desulfosarcina ovata subsp. sediminis TaxID=885957 RepID=A0A5K7ZQC7_9BACT|nr:FAD-dependent oxidoreductase [Desulfosarcina ovata]BBO82419.1 pyridine nucleotide-disulfide oxidoreductase [Desulfosarcina ovata subsp. sediminis]
MPSKQKIVVIGGVACGPKAASRIKRLNPDAEVTIIEKGELLSYAGCGLPFYISGEVESHNELMATPTGVVRDTFFFHKVKGIEIKNHTLVKRVDRKNKCIDAISILSGANVEIPYDKLILTVGSKTQVPPIEGTDLNGVNFLQTVEDARKIRNESGALKGKKAVIIGGGLIGIEVTEAFKKQGMEITVIEMLDKVMGQLLDPEIAYHVHKEFAANGIPLKLSERVLKINGDDRGNVKSVTTDKGEYPADMVLISVGVRPNIQLAQNMELEIGETGAIKVDANLRTSDPDIYAGGDCVENTNRITGKPIYAPMGSTANKHGRVIADNICGIDSKFNGVCGTAICKLFNVNVARTGLTEKMAADLGYDTITVLNPSPDRAHFLKEAKLIIIKLVVDRNTKKLLGAQIVGPGDVAKRMEVAVSNIASGGTVIDIAQYDLAYAPPFSPAMDNIITAANIAENKLNGFGKSYTPMEVKAKIDNNEDFIFLDVRSPQEFEEMRIEDPRVKLIPLGKLRESLDQLPKEKEIVAFCKISLRGYEAERLLTGTGYPNVSYMDGGVVCWPFEKFVAG